VTYDINDRGLLSSKIVPVGDMGGGNKPIGRLKSKYSCDPVDHTTENYFLRRGRF